MHKMSDLPEDLIGEILFRAPLKSLGFMTIGSTIFSPNFDLQGIRNDLGLVDPSIKQDNILGQLKESNVLHCDGIWLCVTTEQSRLLVWNPYLGQRRWIQATQNFSMVQARQNSTKIDVRNNFSTIQAIKKGKKTKGFWVPTIYTRINKYTLGYDNNNHNHKILKFLVSYNTYIGNRINLIVLFEIYDFNSNSWKVLNVTLDWDIWSKIFEDGVSLKGNTYLFGDNNLKDGKKIEVFLLSCDFTTERFGPRLPLPFHFYPDDSYNVTLSSVRDEQLAVLYRVGGPSEVIEIWVTTKIEPNAVSKRKFLKVDMTPLNGFQEDLGDDFDFRTFFIDEEKKLVVFSSEISEFNKGACCSQKACIIREDGYFEYVNLQEALHLGRQDKHSCNHH